MKFFIKIVNGFKENYLLMYLMLFISIALFVYIVYYYLSSEGKDERGRAIIGESSFYSLIIFTIFRNLISYALYPKIDDFESYLIFYSSSTYLVLLLCLNIIIQIKRRLK